MRIKEFLKSLIPNSIAIYRWPVPRDKREILLTFDDGPDEYHTPKVLDILKEHNVKAIFFAIGKKIPSNPDIIKRIAAEGHLLANHSYQHKTGRELSYQDYLGDISKCTNAIEEIVDTKIRYHRPPRGILTLSNMLASRKAGLTNMLWSIESGEWGAFRNESVQQMENRLLNTIQSGDVVLMHDNSTKIPDLLESLLPKLKERGFGFCVPQSS